MANKVPVIVLERSSEASLSLAKFEQAVSECRTIPADKALVKAGMCLTVKLYQAFSSTRGGCEA